MDSVAGLCVLQVLTHFGILFCTIHYLKNNGNLSHMNEPYLRLHIYSL